MFKKYWEMLQSRWKIFIIIREVDIFSSPGSFSALSYVFHMYSLNKQFSMLSSQKM